MSTQKQALWSGRFATGTDQLVLQLSQSISYDRRLYPYDILGSQAHARMLARQGIIPQEDADKIVAGLEQVKAEIDGGAFQFKTELEDIHMNIERALTEKIGALPEKEDPPEKTLGEIRDLMSSLNDQVKTVSDTLTSLSGEV